MNEIQSQLTATLTKWIARAAKLEADAESLCDREDADRLTSMINSKFAAARLYRACANDVARDAGIVLPS